MMDLLKLFVICLGPPFFVRIQYSPDKIYFILLDLTTICIIVINQFFFSFLSSGPNCQPLNSWNFHVLTYEDQEGDWMMVGDVPWE
jgi:hypothetical protein